METKTVTISKWNRRSLDGKMLKQVVIKTPAGRNRKGKNIFRSQTMHIPV
jgi:hypothetical protein